jgi:hypothetical protein
MFAAGTCAQQPTGAGTRQISLSAPSDSSSAQPSAAGAAEDSRGFLLYQKFEGSSSSQGIITQWTTTAGYNFNKYFGVDVGMPFYYLSASSSTGGTTSGIGLGDVFFDGRLSLENRIANFGSTFTVTAPSGNQTMGLSPGQATWDWSNDLDHEIGRFTPFAEVGFGNSIANTTPIHQKNLRFKRPFASVGNVAHFEAGTQLRIWRSLTFSASAYDILPWGPQTVYSRVVMPGTTGTAPGRGRERRVFQQSAIVIGTSNLTRDNGFTSSLSLRPMSFVSVSLGYGRSIPLHLDTLSWGLTFDIAKMWKRARGQSAQVTPDSKVQQGGAL